MKDIIVLALVFAASCIFSAENALAVTFSDGTFNDGDWTATKIVDTTAGALATFTANQAVAAGNPGAYRFVTHDYDFGGIGVAHLRNGANYDPSSQGAISSVSYSYDARVFDPGMSGGVAYTPLLLQGGNYYRSTVLGIFAANAWTPFSLSSLTQSSFVNAVTSSGQPDFSVSGDVIQFGFLSHNGTAGVEHSHTESGIDNWNVMIAVPEPSAGVLILVGLGMLVVAHKASNLRTS